MTQGLTARQTDVAMLVADGLANKEIAHKLAISEKTVRNHVSDAMEKLKVRSRVQLAFKMVRFTDDGRRYCPQCGQELKP